MVFPDTADEVLARQFVLGDATAFDALVLRHRDCVYRFVRSRLGVSPGEAEDITQEVLIEVYRGLARFEGRSRLRSWILGIAANLCRDHRRTSLRRPSSAISDDRWHELPDGSVDLESSLARRETQGAVRQAIDELGEEHRTAVLLRDIEGLSYREIADLLGVPLGTVRSRLHNARALLAARLLPLVAAKES